MKLLTIILIVLGSFDSNAAIPRITKLKNEQKQKANNKNNRSLNNEKALQTLLENSKKLNLLLQQRSAVPVIWNKTDKVLTGKVYRGTLLNSINSTNLASPVLVRAHEGQGLAPKTKFACQGVTQNKRVATVCHKMITPEREISISAQLLNMDGSSGLIGEYDDEKGELIGAAVASNFSQGMLSAAQSRIATPFGAVRDDSVKNQLLQGAIESGRVASDILVNEMAQVEPVITIEAGIEVLIYFMEAINEN
jgi:hypothetical protein